jgi:hypothetical protein
MQQQLGSRWFVRLVHVTIFLSVCSAVALLIVDAPIMAAGSVDYRKWFEACPLLLVGVAGTFWIAIERPRAVEMIKQSLIALAFLLWGVDLLLPAGRWATFIGAIVIAIYVCDLAWMMESGLRKRRELSAQQVEGVAMPSSTVGR